MGSRQQVIHERVAITVSALASLDAVATVSKLDESMGNGLTRLTCKGGMTWAGKTVDVGPTIVGLSLGGNAAETEEALEADPQSYDENPEAEQANRKVWPVWMIPGSAEIAPRNTVEYKEIYLPFKEKPEGQNYQWWVYNAGQATLADLVVIIFATWVGTWMRD